MNFRNRIRQLERHLPPVKPATPLTIIEWRDGEPEPDGVDDPNVMIVEMIDTWPAKFAALRLEFDRIAAMAAETDDDTLDALLDVIADRLTEVENVHDS